MLSRINEGGFTYEELLDMPDLVGSELEVMLYRHEIVPKVEVEERANFVLSTLNN